MRLRHPDGSLLHLAYCSNVHPADDLDGVAAQLERYTARVRERLDVPVLGVGLWVAAPALATSTPPTGSPSSSTASALEVVTLNGFPYKAFHAPVVKRDVYWPHWAQDDAPRVHAGARAAARRAAPGGHRGGEHLHAAARVARGLGRRRAAGRGAARAGRPRRRARGAHARTGKRIRIALEPEPGCTVETIAQACDALRRARARSGSASASTPAISPCSSRPRPTRSRGCDERGRVDRQDAGVERAAGSRRRRRRRGASCSRASTSRGSCTRCASA